MRLTRRALVALVLAGSLTLMHGGIAQAMACSAMASMASAATPMTGQNVMPAHDPSIDNKHAQHHQPGTPPVRSHNAEMCISTPATSGDGGPTGSPGVLATPDSTYKDQPLHQPTVTCATGRHPPAPDLVSVLCVIRR